MTIASCGVCKCCRLPLLSVMQGTYSVPYLFYIHCEAGTDRTGEISGAYYIQARPRIDLQPEANALSND